MTLSPETLSEYGPMVAAVLVGIVVTRIWSWIFRPKWITVTNPELTEDEKEELKKRGYQIGGCATSVFAVGIASFYCGLEHGWIYAGVPFLLVSIPIAIILLVNGFGKDVRW